MRMADVRSWHFASVIAARYYCSDWGNSGRGADIAKATSLTLVRHAEKRLVDNLGLSPAGFKLMSASPARDAGMPHANDSNEEDAMFDKLSANRRDLLIAPLLAAIPTALLGDRANASPVDPNKTFTKLPDQITWEAPRNRPPKTVEQALLWGNSSEPGLYYYLVKWYPGFMSAPHWYETDRLCVVVSGTWWVASGEDFEPNDTVPMPAGSFIRRVARTPHYDGVKKAGKEPAVIAICGMGPITYHLVDPSKPNVRVL